MTTQNALNSNRLTQCGYFFTVYLFFSRKLQLYDNTCSCLFIFSNILLIYSMPSCFLHTNYRPIAHHGLLLTLYVLKPRHYSFCQCLFLFYFCSFFQTFDYFYPAVPAQGPAFKTDFKMYVANNTEWHKNSLCFVLLGQTN